MKLTVLAKRAFPNFRTRLAVRRAVLFPLDVIDFVAGKRDPLVPPRGLWFVGGGHFRENQFLASFVRLCDLQPQHRVLDIGCGIGKQAVPLTRYLSPKGSYEGFDIVPEGIRWCERRITSRFPNFRFRHADIFNKHYNSEGKVSPSDWKFPYADSEFDFAFAISVFTHILPSSAQNYISEVGRVLKPGGKCLLSFFLLNDVSRSMIAEGRSSIHLTHSYGDHSVLDPKFPETAVGLSEDFVKKCHDESGLSIDSTHYGSWCGRGTASFYQDILVSVHK